MKGRHALIASVLPPSIIVEPSYVNIAPVFQPYSTISLFVIAGHCSSVVSGDPNDSSILSKIASNGPPLCASSRLLKCTMGKADYVVTLTFGVVLWSSCRVAGIGRSPDHVTLAQCSSALSREEYHIHQFSTSRIHRQ